MLVEKVKVQGHQTFKVTGHQKPQKFATFGVRIYARAADQAPATQAPTANFVSRSPNLLLTPQTLGNWTDGRISCRHSAPTSFLV